MWLGKYIAYIVDTMDNVYIGCIGDIGDIGVQVPIPLCTGTWVIAATNVHGDA